MNAKAAIHPEAAEIVVVTADNEATCPAPSHVCDREREKKELGGVVECQKKLYSNQLIVAMHRIGLFITTLK